MKVPFQKYHSSIPKRVVYAFVLASICFTSCLDNTKNRFKKETIHLSDLEEYHEIDLKICFECKTLGDILDYERKLGSKRLEFESWQVKRLMKNSINPAGGRWKTKHLDTVPKPYYSPFWEDSYFFFERSETAMNEFNQLVYYRLSLDYDGDNKSLHPVDYIYAKFHLGVEPFGYYPRRYTRIGNSDDYTLSEVKEIESAQFQNAYHSVLKSFFIKIRADYAETSKNYLIDDFYGFWYALERDTLFLEEEWMHEFINTEYVFWDKFDHFRGVLIPNTHAPSRFYQDRGVRNGSNKFEINVSDLSFTLVYYVKNRYSYY